jgi:type IV secretion system protein VirD4
MSQRGVLLGSLDSYYLTDDADTHLAIFGPTSSGKDVAHVIPTAHLWHSSLLITDPKGGTTFNMTVRYRETCSDIVVFAPLEAISTHINVLDTIRKGTTYAFRDAQAIAKSLIAPEQMVRETPTSLHFRELATVLLAGSILYTVYTSRRPSLAGVLAFLTVEQDSLSDCLDVLIKSPHLTGEEKALVSSMGNEIAQVKDRELSGVWTTTMRGLHLYREPTVARNTDTSDIDLNALQDGARPMTMYLVAPSPEQTVPRLTLLVKSKTDAKAILYGKFEGPRDCLHAAGHPRSYGVGDLPSRLTQQSHDFPYTGGELSGLVSMCLNT